MYWEDHFINVIRTLYNSDRMINLPVDLEQ